MPMAGEMFIILAICLLMGIPVGFSVGISATFFLVFFNNMSATIVIHRMIEGINSFPLLALPLFILSGAIMVYGSTPRLIRLANLLLGRLPGGLGAVGSMGSAAFGAISGSANATVAAIGSVVGPEMLDQGYDKGFTASLLAAAGTLGIVIPPSVIIVVYAQSSGASISSLFLAGIVPGVFIAIILSALSVIIAIRRNYKGAKVERHTLKEIIKIVVGAIFPMFMPVIILGGVFSGMFTATEAASVAVVYSLILAKFIYREISWKETFTVLVNSSKITAMLLFIIAAASPFGWALAIERVPHLVSEAILATIHSPILISVIVMFVLIVLGTFMESFSIVILATPIFLPIMIGIGVDPVVFGIVMTLAICIGAITPPLAVCLFTSCRILNMRVEETMPDVFMPIAIFLVAMFLVMFVPQIVLWLPSVLL